MKGVRRIVGALALALAMAGPAAAERFSFVAVDDTAYNPPADYPVYERLIARINRASPAFTIHLGDTWGAMVCTEANHRMIRGWFDKYDQVKAVRVTVDTDAPWVFGFEPLHD